MRHQMFGWLRTGARRLLPPGEAYALWAPRYPPCAHNALMRAEQSIVESILAAAAPARALDVGTGSGRYLPLLAAAGARFVAGLDFSLPMLRQQTAGRPRVCGDATHLPFRHAAADLISSALMAGDIADLAACIDEFGRVLAPGGLLVYSDFHPAWVAGGWRRTFADAAGRCCELGYFPHTIEQHLDCLEHAAFDVVRVHEPTLDPRERPSNGPSPTTPVLAIFHAVKRC